jgi:hypothetical protein
MLKYTEKANLQLYFSIQHSAFSIQHAPYSALSAVTGSTRVAFRAGM